ncbi:MAG TPA: amino acid adenylation domain-containing protein, partial [Kofleriaceae bacterium]|nr:amino acid adenylation domain-containing protein [Kofleriaceae bacterium]
GEDQLTYAELDGRAAELARHLRRAGVRPGTLVGLCVERSLSTVVAILGILKAGGAYLPLDPDSPAGRLAFILEDAAVAHLVLHDELRERFTALPTHTLAIRQDGTFDEALAPRAADDAADAADDATNSADCPDVRTEHLAYVIYTSGSTGQPKGVYITHANVARLFTVTEPWFQFSASDVWTLFHSYAFDFSVWELWGALLYGGRLVVVPYWVSRNPEAFRGLLCQEAVTVLNQTPSAFYQLMRADEQAAGRPDAGALALRAIIFGGEALDLARLRPWIERHGDDAPRLINMYGITETTVHVTYRQIRRADAEANRGSLIGVALPDLALAVLSPQGQPVPIGVAGELHVGGAGVGEGYLGRDELTRSRFITGQQDAYSAALPAGTRWYRSGDLVRYLADGELEYLGRIDQQIKLRGFRIELGEIESALAEHPAVQDSAVLLREDKPGHKRLVGYVVAARRDADEATGFDAEAVLAFLHERMPDYMVPSALVVLPVFPLTVNGKLDRRALPAPELPQAQTGSAPLGGLERTLAEVWSQVLGLEVKSRED